MGKHINFLLVLGIVFLITVAFSTAVGFPQLYPQAFHREGNKFDQGTDPAYYCASYDGTLLFANGHGFGGGAFDGWLRARRHPP